MNKIIAKYVDVQIEFVTPCLSDFWNQENYEFFRDDEHCVVLRHRHLFAMLTKAKAAIDSKIDIRKVDFVTSIVADTVKLPVSYEDGGQAMHEAIPVGEPVWFSFGLEADVAFDDFMALMREAGDSVGLSPARSFDNYGRFKVLEGTERWLDQEPTSQS